MFKFKQFIISQENTSMKVCTDSCLFGALISASHPDTILDIGTGSGLLSLMLAQKYPNSKVTAVEIDEGAYIDAKANFNLSKFDNIITPFHESIQEFSLKTESKFDLIVSNPPFFHNNLKSSEINKNIAKHSLELSFDELSEIVNSHLSEKGVFWVLLPPTEMNKFEKLMQSLNFNVSESYFFKNTINAPIIREAKAFTKCLDIDLISETVIIKTDNKSVYTERYMELLRDFYLIF